MKTLKKLLPALALLMCFAFAFILFYSTNNHETKLRNPEPYTRFHADCKSTEIEVIDGCEYIYCWFGQMNGGGSLTHKGNCKFCYSNIPRPQTNIYGTRFQADCIGYKLVEIIEIDSCEYIYCWFGQMNGGGSLTHKGNCKVCKQRAK